VTRGDIQASEGQALPFTYMRADEADASGHGVRRGRWRNANYIGIFAKTRCRDVGTGSDWFNTPVVPPARQCMGLGAVDGTTGLSGRLAIVGAGAYSGIGAPTSSWAAGVGAFTVHVKLNRNSIPDGPYQLLKFGAMPRDSEGVTLPGTASADPTRSILMRPPAIPWPAIRMARMSVNWYLPRDVRFGRLWMGNAYGPNNAT